MNSTEKPAGEENVADPYLPPSTEAASAPPAPLGVSPRKRSLARNGLLIGIIIAALGGFAACDCNGFGILSVLFEIAPLYWGSRTEKIVALSVVVIDVIMGLPR